jgi:sugar/nucleoside kinase (ribokinase family)
METPEIILFGHLALDTYVVHGNRKTVFDVPAGNALGAVAGALAWNSHVGVVSRAGSDFPADVFSKLRDNGADLAGVRRLEQASIHFWILQEETSEPSRIAIAFNKVDIAQLTPQISDIPSAYLSAKAAHIAPMPIEQQAILAKQLKSAGLVTSLDPLPPSYQLNPSTCRDMLLDLLDSVDIFIPSKPEMHEIFGQLSLPQILHLCFERNVKVVLIRNGEHGSTIYLPNNLAGIHIPAVPVSVLETSGAGDAYCGGFLAEYSRSGDAFESALRGAVSASFMLEQWGRLEHLHRQSEIGQRLERIRELCAGRANKAA